ACKDRRGVCFASRGRFRRPPILNVRHAEQFAAADRAAMLVFRDMTPSPAARLLSCGVRPDLKAHGVTFMSASDSPRSSDFFDSAYGGTPPWGIGAEQPGLSSLFCDDPPHGPVHCRVSCPARIGVEWAK